MAELTISAADIQGAIEDYVSSFSADSDREEVGTVIDAGDGIAHVEGLPSVMTQELLEFPGGVLGVAFAPDGPTQNETGTDASATSPARRTSSASSTSRTASTPSATPTPSGRS